MSWPADEDLGIRIRVYLGADPTVDPSEWPAPTDLSSRLMRKPISIRRGRNRNQQTISSGQCTFWLENTDGALTPLLPTSTYFPDWDLGVPVDVAVTNVGPNPPHTRFAGFVADVQARMVPGAAGVNVSAVQVTLGGAWRRITQGAVEKSALKRTYLAASPALLAYWPCEDADGATQVASGLAGGPPLTGGTPRFTTGITGSAGALDLMTTSALGVSAHILLPSAVGFQLEYSVLCDASEIVLTLKTGDINLALTVNPTIADGLPHHASYIFQQNGSALDATLYRDGVYISGPTPFVSGTMTAELTITAATSNPPSTTTLMLSHIAIYGFADATAPTTRAGAADGYSGEEAHARAERVCGEEGVPFSGTALRSNECGAQPVADVAGVLVDLEQIDHGMIVEDFAFGLAYRASSQRENLDPVMTIDLETYRTTSGTQADVLTPIRGDQRIRNEWTISRPEGSSAVAKDATHQAKRGRYNDSASVNVEDDTRILDEAQWRVHEGTFDGLRYQTVPLDIAANVD